MAFKVLANKNSGQAVSIENVKQVTGFLLSVAIIEGKKKGRNASALYTIQNEDGSKIKLWGCSAINGELLFPDGEITAKTDVAPEYLGKLVRLTYQGKVKVKGRSQPMKKVLVEVDMDSSAPTPKKYVLKKK